MYIIEWQECERAGLQESLESRVFVWNFRFDRGDDRGLRERPAAGLDLRPLADNGTRTIGTH